MWTSLASLVLLLQATALSRAEIVENKMMLEPEKRQTGTLEKSTPMNQAARDAVVAIHNQLRASVDPPAQSMEQIVYDLNLEKVAQAYADKCIWAHNQDRESEYESTSGTTLGLNENIGENLAVWTYNKSLEEAVREATQAWYDEVSGYNHCTCECTIPMCGHYTQVVWAETASIGCGVSHCAGIFPPQSAQYTACNYRPGGNFRGVQTYLAVGKSARTQFERKCGEMCSAEDGGNGGGGNGTTTTVESTTTTTTVVRTVVEYKNSSGRVSSVVSMMAAAAAFAAFMHLNQLFRV